MVSAALASKQIPPVRPVPGDFHQRQTHLLATALKKPVEAPENEVAECDQVKEQLAAVYLVMQSNASIPRPQGTQWLNEYLTPVTQGAVVRLWGGNLGLLNLSERVLLLVGDIKLRSIPNRASRVWACFPLDVCTSVERRVAARLSE